MRTFCKPLSVPSFACWVDKVRTLTTSKIKWRKWSIVEIKRTRSTISQRVNDWRILSEMLNLSKSFLASLSCKRRKSASVPVTTRRLCFNSSLIWNVHHPEEETFSIEKILRFSFTFGLWTFFAEKFRFRFEMKRKSSVFFRTHNRCRKSALDIFLSTPRDKLDSCSKAPGEFLRGKFDHFFVHRFRRVRNETFPRNRRLESRMNISSIANNFSETFQALLGGTHRCVRAKHFSLN